MRVLIVGSGYMCEEYYKVLKDIGIQDIWIVGRGREKIDKLKKEYNIEKAFYGGLSEFIKNFDRKIHFDLIINTVNVENLYEINKFILESNLGNLLLSEKPGCLNSEEADYLNNLSKVKNKKIFIAYNRRFYSSVLKLKNLLLNKKDILSIFFSFTEILEKIIKQNFPKEVKKKLLIANSSHVIDLVFHLIGMPAELNSFYYYKNEDFNYGIYYGSGLSENNIPFVYHSNWLSKGRWLIEIYCKNYKYILCPLEKLIIQKDNFNKELEIIDEDDDDKNFKPGLKKMLLSVINKNDLYENLCTINELTKTMKFYESIGGYNK